MKQMAKIIAIAAMAGVLAACASGGNEALKNQTESTISTKLAKGMDKGAVKSKIGSPESISYTDGGLEIWTYAYSNVQSKATNFIPVVNLFVSGAEGTKKTLVILFGDDDRVKKFTMSESKIDTKQGILGGE